jgi:hypothetical protein
MGKHKLAANGSINRPEIHDLLLFSECHFQRYHGRRIIKWPLVQKEAITRPRVDPGLGAQAGNTTTAVVSENPV